MSVYANNMLNQMQIEPRTKAAWGRKRTVPRCANVLNKQTIAIARTAISAHLHGHEYIPPSLPVIPGCAGLFVTLWTGKNTLRGCMGELGPQPALGDAIARCAVAAAVRDSRFRPLSLCDLARVTVEISLLCQPHRVSSLEELDPARYGVIVRQGKQRGVLLPAIPGIEQAQDQVAIACRKGFIDTERHFVIDRFEVHKVRQGETRPEKDTDIATNKAMNHAVQPQMREGQSK